MKSAQNSMSLRFLSMVMLATFLSSAVFLGCGGTGGAADGEAVINGKLTNCNADSMRLYHVSGTHIDRVGAAKMEKDGANVSFSLHYKIDKPGFYLIGDDPRRAANIVLGEGGSFDFTGDCQNAQSYRLVGAATHDAYNTLQQRVNAHGQQLQGLYQNMQVFSQTDPMQVSRIQQDIANLNKGHFAYLDSLKSKGGFLGKVAEMYNFKPYKDDPSHSQYPTELEYFRLAFFSNVNFDDAEVASFPQIYDKARAYTSTLCSQGLPAELIQKSTDDVLAKAKSGSLGHESLLRGFLAGFEQTKSPLLVTYGKIYTSTYPSNDPQYVASLNNMMAQMAATIEGADAPDIQANTPAGKPMKLSDFRGKVVMIDFWASWCRPCRMENPNVLKAYNKYHKKGFEILGVSLDQEKGKWEAAIQQDGLIWNHISDLGGWQSQPAQVYGVSSIPATVLVDKEGKIIARNLRGPALEDKLKEIFGS